MSRRATAAALVAVALLLVAAPALPSYYLGLLTKALILGIFAMSLNVLLGYTGLGSFGHALYFGIGAYTVGLLALKVVAGFWIDTLAALFVSAVVALTLAPLTLRARGSYFAMITLALAQVAWGVAFGWRSLTGGDDGLPGVGRPVIAGVALTSETSFFYLVAVVFALTTLGVGVLVESPFGKALSGIKESEIRMEVLGYDVWTYQYAASVVAGVLAGLAGALFVYYNGYVSPVYLSVVFSAQALFMVVLGGTGTLLGPAIGAVIIVLLENLISVFTERWLLVLGVVYMLVTLFAPRGVHGLFQRARPRRGHA
jgi:branched-chain amino acid transport system permease protein